MGAIIILSMIASIFAVYVDQYSTSTLTYGKQEFQVLQNSYTTKINKTIMSFSYYPAELERINISAVSIQELRASPFIVILIDTNSSIEDLSYIDAMRFDLEKQIGKPVYTVVTAVTEQYQTLPVLSCANASIQTPFIYVTVNSTTGFSEETPGCITMHGRLQEFIALKDRLVYGYYGIMQ